MWYKNATNYSTVEHVISKTMRFMMMAAIQ